MRSLAAACALIAIAHADASLPAAPLAPAPVPTTLRFTTPWPRLVECTRFAKAQLVGNGRDPKGQWSGPAGKVSFSTVSAGVALTQQELPRDAAGRLTRLTVELTRQDPLAFVSLSVGCLDAPAIEYRWLCDSNLCSPSKSSSQLAAGVAAPSWSEPAMRATMQALGKLDPAAASARSDEFARLGRRLIADAPRLVAAACKLGCTPAAERAAAAAAKLAAAPFRFVDADPVSGYGGAFHDVTGIAVDFDADDAQVRVTCGSGYRSSLSQREPYCAVEVNQFSLFAWSSPSGYQGKIAPNGRFGGSIYVGEHELAVSQEALELAR